MSFGEKVSAIILSSALLDAHIACNYIFAEECIGREVIKLTRKTNLLVCVCAGDSTGYAFRENGLDPGEVLRAKEQEDITQLPGFTKEFPLEKIDEAIIVDATASAETAVLLGKAIHQGHSIVLANKKPLSSRYSSFQMLHEGSGKIFYETTVAAGLPVVYTLQSLLLTGDEILSIQGCFSGTLNYIFSELEKGRRFSEIVKEAHDLGYTEPDPRDDLSGLDVARKLLILARMLGKLIELEDIAVQSLVPDSLRECSIGNFFRQLPLHDLSISLRIEKAKETGKTLRYVASISDSRIKVGLQEVPLSGDLGGLHGPDNICIIQSRKYNKNPLVIKGPGAGPAVTADGVYRNMLECL